MANKEGSGVIFKNTKKMNEKSPDYSGSINIGGKEVKFSGWVRQAKSGTKYISLAVNTAPSQKNPPKNVQQNPIIDDSIPWD